MRPHVLKDVHNNLLEKEARFIQNGIVKKAKWQHIINIYELDEGDGVFLYFSERLRLSNIIEGCLTTRYEDAKA